MVVENDAEEGGGEPASSSTAGPRVPSLNEFDPNVRWWSNLTGFRDPFDAGDVQSLLSPETSRTLIANLQGLEVGDRARATTSLLAFVGLFVAELLKVVNDAEHGERVELLQRWMQMTDYEEASLVQTNQVVGPGTFAKLPVDLQSKLELKGKKAASAAAAHLSRRLQNMQEGSGKRTTDRRDRLRALLVAYDNEDTGLEDGEPCELSTIWDSICPFIVGE